MQLPDTTQVLVSLHTAVYPAPAEFASHIARHVFPTVVPMQVGKAVLLVVPFMVPLGQPALLGARDDSGMLLHALTAK